MIHGGPTWHHSNEWDALRQAFVAAGVTVLHPNYRGSDGYGRTLAARQPLPHGPGRGAGLRRRPRVPRGARLRPGAHRRDRPQLGRVPHDGDGDAVPGAVGGRRGRRALLRLHRLRPGPGHPRGPALVGPAEHRRPGEGPRQARVLLADQRTSTASRRRCCCSPASWTRAARRGSRARWRSCWPSAARAARSWSTPTRATRSAGSSTASTTTCAPWSSSSSTSASRRRRPGRGAFPRRDAGPAHTPAGTSSAIDSARPRTHSPGRWSR